MQNTKCKNTAVKSNSSLNTTIKGIKGALVYGNNGNVIMPKNSTPLSSLGGVVVKSNITAHAKTPHQCVKSGVVVNYYKALYSSKTLNTLDFLKGGATISSLNTLYNNISVLMYCGLITPYTTHNTTVGGVVVKGANNHTATINTNAIQKALKSGIMPIVNGVTLTPRHIKGGNKFLTVIKSLGV